MVSKVGNSIGQIPGKSYWPVRPDSAKVPEGALFFYENVCRHYSEALSE